MSQGELTSRDNKRETGSKTRELEKYWLTNSNNDREIGSKSATMRENLAHKLRFEERNNERKIGSQTRERQGVSGSHSKSKRLTFLAYFKLVLLQNN